MPVPSTQKKLSHKQVIAQIQSNQGKTAESKTTAGEVRAGEKDSADLLDSPLGATTSTPIPKITAEPIAPKASEKIAAQPLFSPPSPPMVDVDLNTPHGTTNEKIAEVLPSAPAILDKETASEEEKFSGPALREMLRTKLCEPARPPLYLNEIEAICRPIEKISDLELKKAVIEQTEAIRTPSMRGDLKDIVVAFVSLKTPSDVSLVGEVMIDICRGAERAHLVAGDIAEMIACVARLGADSQRLAIALTAHQGKHTVHLRRRIMWLKGAAELHRDVRLDLMRLVQPKMCEEGDRAWNAENMVALGRVIERLNATREAPMAGPRSEAGAVFYQDPTLQLLAPAEQRQLLFLWNDLDDQSGGERSVAELARFIESLANLPSKLWAEAQRTGQAIIGTQKSMKGTPLRQALFDVLAELHSFRVSDWSGLASRLQTFRLTDRNTVELIRLLAEAQNSGGATTLDLARPLARTMSELRQYYAALKEIDADARQTVADSEQAMLRANSLEDRLDRFQQVWLNSLRDRDFIQVERS